MRLPTTHRLVGTVPVPLIEAFAANIKESDWTVMDYRKQMVPHDGQYDSMVFRHSPDYDNATVQNMPLFSGYEAVLTPIVDCLRSFYRVDDYVALLARLKPGSNVHPHGDVGDFLETIHRVHIPIVTNPNAYYVIDYETIRMTVGNAYEIDNQREHSAWNMDQAGDRIHLIVNIYGEPL